MLDAKEKSLHQMLLIKLWLLIQDNNQIDAVRACSVMTCLTLNVCVKKYFGRDLVTTKEVDLEQQ